MDETFDYSNVPYNFGMCADGNCPNAATCLRQIALQQAPAETSFLLMLNPKAKKEKNGTCKYYCPKIKIRYAKGFMRTMNALTLRVADTFRWRMIACFGRKNYYLKRKGELLLSPAEQQSVVALAKELGVVLDEYFDEYIDAYRWE